MAVTSGLDDDVITYPTRITCGVDEDSFIFPSRITSGIDEDSLVYPSRATSLLDDDSIAWLGSVTSGIDEGDGGGFVFPSGSLCAVSNEPLDFTSTMSMCKTRDAAVEFTPTTSLSPCANELLDFIPGLSFCIVRDADIDLIPSSQMCAVRDDLVNAHILGVRGPQIASSPKGAGTDNLQDNIFSADEFGRLKVATNYINDAAAASHFAANAIDSTVATTKFASASILLSKLAAGTKERLATPDKNMFVSTPTTGNDANTGLAVAGAPAAGGYVGVLVNGVLREVGDGVKTKDCYFSGDAGATARAYGAVTTGDVLFWNGVIAGANLLTTDRLDFQYVYSSN